MCIFRENNKYARNSKAAHCQLIHIQISLVEQIRINQLE